MPLMKSYMKFNNGHNKLVVSEARMAVALRGTVPKRRHGEGASHVVFLDLGVITPKGFTL